ncbi:hypothetical protein [Aromatoleum diolicum]|uniref:Uncharacterized protein n=1 Tax=Aromatoleum diolicum TaxID=75796 RepID=A0ABX1Q8F1_9RHOO|nr:hypothetical protein [Aromatoleum diolicum]NMG73711.1 hypothetical protein [Aromatoleum diolicum]
MTSKNGKTRGQAGSFDDAIAWENECSNRSASPVSVQAQPTVADLAFVQDVLRAESSRLQVALYRADGCSSLEIYGYAPKSAALRKIKRGKKVPLVLWRTPHGGGYGVSLADIPRLVAAAARRGA